MSDSILESVKKVLGLSADYDVFDQDLILNINSVLSTLNQLGVGPAAGFMIEDDTATWTTFLGSDPRLNNVKSYMALRVRMVFDPPTTSFLLSALKEQIEELSWRINVQREEEGWIDPDPPVLPEE
jgi:hypothetical protein